MTDGEILYNLNSIIDGEEVQIYSKGEDLFRNDKIDIYTIGRENNRFYVKFDKKTSLDGSQGYFLKEEISFIGVSMYNENKIAEMRLSTYEKECLKETSFEHLIIRRGYDLEGKFLNGLHFKYKNIIMVTKVVKEDKCSV